VGELASVAAVHGEMTWRFHPAKSARRVWVNSDGEGRRISRTYRHPKLGTTLLHVFLRYVVKRKRQK
jgi:hypothetical protein